MKHNMLDKIEGELKSYMFMRSPDKILQSRAYNGLNLCPGHKN